MTGRERAGEAARERERACPLSVNGEHLERKAAGICPIIQDRRASAAAAGLLKGPRVDFEMLLTRIQSMALGRRRARGDKSSLLHDAVI